MHVIRHDHVPPNRDGKLIESPIGTLLKCLMCSLQIFDLSSVNRADRHKEQRRIISLKNLMEPRWAVLDH